MALGSSPIGSTSLSGELALNSAGGGSQSISVAALAINWTIPSQSISGSGTVALSISVLVGGTWTVPTQSLTQPGSVALVTATAAWVIPTQTLSPSGVVALSISVMDIHWGFPFPRLSGGISLDTNKRLPKLPTLPKLRTIIRKY